jgi:hypothetical protein
LDALRDSASSDRLYREVSDLHKDSLLEGLQHGLNALNARMRYLRSSVLFSAMAAEAYANEFLAAFLSAKDLEAVDRLRSSDKLLLGPRLCREQDVLERGAEPHASLTALFDTRNRLIHAKPGRFAGYVGQGYEEDENLYGPEKAVRFLVAVAHAAVLLHPLRPDRPFAMPFSDIYEHRAVLERHLDATGRRIGDVPRRDHPPAPDLALEMERRRYRRAAQRS